MKGQYNILVIEDTEENLAVARRVYGADPRISAEYATTFEEASERLQQGGLDGVVTDMFFPSRTDWKGYLHQKSGYEQVMGLENPSGVGIIEHCEKNSLPYVVASQGDRHQGNIGTVRYAFEKMYKDQGTPSINFLLHNVNRGDRVDKSQEETWKDAIDTNTGRDMYFGLVNQIGGELESYLEKVRKSSRSRRAL